MGGRRILSDQQLDEMVGLRERGWGTARIAQHFTDAGTPVSVGSIGWQCLRLGADVPPRLRNRCPGVRAVCRRGGHIVRPFSPAEDDLLRQLDHRGERVSEIARQLGRKENSIRGRLLTLARHEARAEDTI